jgi:uncharacterized protein with NRDE domain
MGFAIRSRKRSIGGTMCVLVILFRALDGVPLLVGANRDESYDRPGAPPGLLECGARRALAPRDRRAGGTWIGFNDRGVFAALTNRPGAVDATRVTRGEIVPLALGEETALAARARIAERIARGGDNPFRIVVADGKLAFALANDGAPERDLAPGLHWLTNEHGLDPFEVPALAPLAATRSAAEAERALRAVLADHTPDRNGHRFCKHGERYGTVSSTIVGIPDAGALAADLWYAPGAPCTVEYQRYSNLTRRLESR